MTAFDPSRSHPWLALERLEALGPQRRGVFALGCGERLERLFYELAEISGEIEPGLLRRALDQGWAVLEGANGAPGSLGETARALGELLPSAEDDPGQRTLKGAELGDALITVAEALAAVTGGAVPATTHAAVKVFGMLQQFIFARDGRGAPRQFGRTGPVLDELYRAESNLQEQRLRELSAMPVRLSSDVLERLRTRFRAEVLALETLLLSEPDAPRASLRLAADPCALASLEPGLAALTPERRAAFAALCAERMAPLYRSISGRLLPTAERVLDDAVEGLWQCLMAGPGRAEALAPLEARLSEAGADPAFDGPEGRHARAALEAGRGAMRALSSDSMAEARQACAQPYAVLSDYIVAYHRADPSHADAWKLILRHPLYRAERIRQRVDIAAFQRAPGLPTAFYRDHYRPPTRREALPIHFSAPAHPPKQAPASH